MQRYGDVGRDAGVRAYETGDDFIRVEFHDGAIYLYTYASTGAEDVERMKELAARGEGLTTFISHQVRKRFARKER